MPRSTSPNSIAEQQDAFARALLWRDEAVPQMLTMNKRAASSKRFGVYRNNVFSSLTRCIASRFPVVVRLVGEDFFNATARVFIESNPPASPVLLEYGEEFPRFLETFAPARSVPYLVDVARLEWLVASAYHAPDARPVNAGLLGTLGAGVLDAALRMHTSCALLISRYPIFSIWETNARDEIVRPIDASSSGEAALIVRPRFEVRVIRLDTATYAFVTALCVGHALELSAEIAAEIDDRFDVGEALQMLFANGAIVGVQAARNYQPAEPQSIRMPSCAT